jgi:phosphate-selective porin OprO and OprP
MTMRLCSILIGAALALGSSGAISSETDRLMELLIQKQILTEQEAQAIREEAATEKKVEQVPLVGQDLGYEPTAPLPVDEGAEIFVRRLGVQTADGSERFRIRGRVQLDAGIADLEDLEEVAREDTLAEYGVIFRRIRLGALGLMREKFEWQLELEFSENAVELDNTYMGYLMDHGAIFKLGLFKEPFTLEYDTSSRYITFIERSAAVDAYKVNKEPGMMYQTIKPNYHVSVGVFGSGIQFERNIEEGYSVAGRGTFAPYLNGTDFVHLGAAINYRKNRENVAENYYEPLRLRTREGMRVIDARLVGRDDLMGVEDFTRYGLEFAAGKGSWWVQSEYIKVDLDLDPTKVMPGETLNVDENSITQDGWYFYTGYYLTGESKPYRAFGGDFANLRPNANFNPSANGYGAFELAFGYSVADSREHTRVGRGQKQDRYVLGLNWYLTPETMFKFNVIYLEGERDIYDGDGWVYGARAQYFF